MQTIGWIFRTLLSVALVLVGYDHAQGQFVYVNNETAPNTVSAFQLNSDGTLTPVPGSPFPTAGVGGGIQGFVDFSNATIHVNNDFLFVCNTLSHTVSVFMIRPDGSLTAIPRSPFATGGRFPIAVTTNPQGTLLFVSNHDTGNLSVFTIGQGGVLSPVRGSPFDLQPLRQPTSLAINSTGTMLLIGGENALGIYTVSADGPVTAVTAPVETGLNTQAVTLTENDRFVYVAGLNAPRGLAGFRLSSDGQLTSLAGSPFPAPSPSGFLGLAVNPRGNLLAATVPGESNVYLYRVDAGGNLSLTAGSPYPGDGGELKPIRMDPTGTFVLAADVMNHTIHVWRINAFARTLTEITGSPFDLRHARARPSGIAFK